MKILHCLLIMLAASVGANAQAGFSRGSGIAFQKVPNGFITQLPPAPAQVLGDYYLNSDWRTGKIYLIDNQSIEDVPIRYEAKLNQFEIKDGEIVKVLHGSRVLFFSWYNGENAAEETYMKLQNYALNGTTFNGFARIVVDGEKFRLFEVTRFSETIPTYNAALDVGSRNGTIKKEDTYYLAKSKKMMELSKNKKKLVKTVNAFAEKDITPFVKEQALSFRSEKDFAVLASELNK